MVAFLPPAGRFTDPNLHLVLEQAVLDDEFALAPVMRGQSVAFWLAWNRNKCRDRMAPAETDEQAVFVASARSTGLLVSSVPNGGHREARTAIQMKREGLSPGFPDLLIWRDTGGPVAMEFKRMNASLSDLSPMQLDWLEKLHKRGVSAWAVLGYRAGQSVLRHLGLLPTKSNNMGEG